MNNFNTSIGLESIEVQTDGFDSKLTAWVDELKLLLETNKHTSPAVNAHVKKFNEMIKDRLNMSVNLKLLKNTYNAWAAIPFLNQNQGILNKFFRAIASTLVEDFYKQFDEAFKKNPVGWVDLKTAKVYGVYSEIVTDIGLGVPIITDKQMESRGIAGILMHELGHTFDTFSNASIMETYTKGLSEIQRAMVGISDPEGRKVILEYLNHKNYVNIPHENIERIVKLDPDKIVQVIAIDRIATIKSQTGATGYENKLSEQSADVFASRFGFNKDLVLALNNFTSSLIDKVTYTPKRNKITHWSIQTLNLAGAILGTALLPTVFPFFIALQVLFSDDSEFVYDNEKDRYTKLRQQLVIRLKNPELDKNDRMTLLSEISTIDKVLKLYKDNVDFYTALGRLFVKSYRSKNRQNEVLYHLERMANNKLFESASKLKNLF